jgi:2'-5' RNA ligase
MSETFRAFIAIDLPASIRSSLGETQEILKSFGLRVKWVRPQNIHLTLKFLGDIDSDHIEKIIAAMTLTIKDFTGVSLSAKEIGVFPNSRRPRVIWAGLSGQLERLQNLQRTLDSHLAVLGFSRETRAFKGHLTLGRVKGKIDFARMKTAIDKLKGFESESFETSEIILFRSELRPTGAVYSKVQRVTLSSND